MAHLPFTVQIPRAAVHERRGTRSLVAFFALLAGVPMLLTIGAGLDALKLDARVVAVLVFLAMVAPMLGLHRLWRRHHGITAWRMEDDRLVGLDDKDNERPLAFADVRLYQMRPLWLYGGDVRLSIMGTGTMGTGKMALHIRDEWEVKPLAPLLARHMVPVLAKDIMARMDSGESIQLREQRPWIFTWLVASVLAVTLFPVFVAWGLRMDGMPRDLESAFEAFIMAGAAVAVLWTGWAMRDLFRMWLNVWRTGGLLLTREGLRPISGGPPLGWSDVQDVIPDDVGLRIMGSRRTLRVSYTAANFAALPAVLRSRTRCKLKDKHLPENYRPMI